jgi:hypothetical protein
MHCGTSERMSKEQSGWMAGFADANEDHARRMLSAALELIDLENVHRHSKRFQM